MASLGARGAWPVAGALGIALLLPAGRRPVDASQAPPTGTITGVVDVITTASRRLASAGAYPGRTVGGHATPPPSERTNVVVFVDTDPKPSPPMRVVIRQQDETFVPHTVAVTTGSTVDFPNDDLVFHNVFSLSRAASFDLGHYPKGESKARTFDRPGLVKVFCHLHSHMSANIRVFDHPYFAVPDETGTFTIEGLTAGRHRVVAWHERVGDVTLETVVPAGGTARLAFSLPLTDE